MVYTFRKAVKEDNARIEELFIEMLQTIYHTNEVKGYDDGYLDKFFEGREEWICLAEDKGVTVAFLSIEVHREQEEFLYLDDLSVTKEYRSKGIGTALIKKAESYAGEIGIPAIVFHVEKSNVSAFRLYERLGYRIFREDGSRYLMHKDCPADYRNQIYYINGTAYAGKSTMVKMLAEKYGGIACEENYHDSMLEKLGSKEFPCLTYTRDLKDWSDFIRRTPEEYEAWIKGVSKECEILELQILKELSRQGKKIFVDTNISVETLQRISHREHVLIMLADPEISVNRFFQRPDREKQFLYQLLMREPDPQAAMDNFRECLRRINSRENYNKFLNSGFRVILRDEGRTPEETLALCAGAFHLT